MFFDPVYLLFVGPAVLLALWAQWRVQSAYATASGVPPASGLSGAQAARAILDSAGLQRVPIEVSSGWLSDHYDPSEKVVRLSPEVYAGRSMASLGIAAHEVGHALQDAQGYTLLTVRNAIVPMANLGGNVSWILLLAGFAMSLSGLIYLGIAAFSLTVLFQLVNLPVEFDASRRARELLSRLGMIHPAEEPMVRKVLSAAALTYVAATLTSAMQLLYFLYRAGLIGGRRDDDRA